MPSRAQRERSERRRALRLLAGAPEGVTEALMLAHGFRVELLVDLCIAGLATAKPEHMRAGRRTMEVVRMKITEAGRQAHTSCSNVRRNPSCTSGLFLTFCVASWTSRGTMKTRPPVSTMTSFVLTVMWGGASFLITAS